MWKKILSTLLGLTVLIAAALAYGASRWQSATDELHANLKGGRRPVAPKTYRSATATMRDGDSTVTLLFRFGPHGLIDSMRAKARGAQIDGVNVPTPWEGSFSRYELRDGMRVPMEGEVVWMLEAGPWPYWRGRITSITYEFTP